jgi:hypothetical protein
MVAGHIAIVRGIVAATFVAAMVVAAFLAFGGYRARLVWKRRRDRRKVVKTR